MYGVQRLPSNRAACACFAFLGYLVELPSLYVSAGIGIAVLLARRTPRHVLYRLTCTSRS